MNKFFYQKVINKWIFNIIPNVHLYFESHSPLEHKRLIKDGITGIFLTFSWGKWEFIFGYTKHYG